MKRSKGNVKISSLLWHILGVCCILVGILWLMPMHTLMAWLIAVNITSFLAFGWDKKRAKNGWRRTPEATFHWLGLLGGFAGIFSGRKFFRHKTIKKEFIIPMWTFFCLQVLAVAYIVLSI